MKRNIIYEQIQKELQENDDSKTLDLMLQLHENISSSHIIATTALIFLLVSGLKSAKANWQSASKINNIFTKEQIKCKGLEKAERKKCQYELKIKAHNIVLDGLNKSLSQCKSHGFGGNIKKCIDKNTRYISKVKRSLEILKAYPPKK